jgi:hypothetical protein
MDTSAATARPARPRRARPGRGVLVVADLADLAGPAEGTVELPLWLFWSAADRTFDLGRPGALREMYQNVLREATRLTDLTSHLNAAVLVEVWPELFLPKGVRLAWEDRHPVLRRAAAAPAA